MVCPNCGSYQVKVTDSRLVGDEQKQRRRRLCLSCNVRFTTVEICLDQLKELEKSAALLRSIRHLCEDIMEEI